MVLRMEGALGVRGPVSKWPRGSWRVDSKDTEGWLFGERIEGCGEWVLDLVRRLAVARFCVGHRREAEVDQVRRERGWRGRRRWGHVPNMNC